MSFIVHFIKEKNIKSAEIKSYSESYLQWKCEGIVDFFIMVKISRESDNNSNKHDNNIECTVVI